MILYGPPAAGKLTVARVLADRYGPALLDNHIAVDAALRLFDFGTEPFADLCEQIRVSMLRAAARAGGDVVSTFMYGYPDDDPAMEALIDASESGGARVTLVQRAPSDAALRTRAVGEDRRASNKVSDLELLDSLLTRHDLRTPFHGTDLSLDNTDTTPEQVAARIAELVGWQLRAD